MNRHGQQREKTEMSRSEASEKFDFFDIPGKVLHLDGDEEYLKMCLKTYQQLNIEAVKKPEFLNQHEMIW